MACEYKIAKKIAEQYGLNEQTVLHMLRNEADNEQTNHRAKYPQSIEIAASRIEDWIMTANEYAVDTTNLLDLADFVASHRTACVWAVLIGKAKRTSR